MQSDPKPAATKDTRKLVKTRYPGIYKRVNAAGEQCGYVAIYRAGGKQRKRVCKTLEEARRVCWTSTRTAISVSACASRT